MKNEWAEDRQEHQQQMFPKIGREMKQKSENNNFAPAPCAALVTEAGQPWHIWEQCDICVMMMATRGDPGGNYLP